MSAAAPRREPSAAPTTITPSVCPVIGTRPERDRDLREDGDEGGAGEDESGVEGECAAARGRAGDDIGEDAAGAEGAAMADMDSA